MTVYDPSKIQLLRTQLNENTATPADAELLSSIASNFDRKSGASAFLGGLAEGAATGVKSQLAQKQQALAQIEEYKKQLEQHVKMRETVAKATSDAAAYAVPAYLEFAKSGNTTALKQNLEFAAKSAIEGIGGRFLGLDLVADDPRQFYARYVDPFTGEEVSQPFNAMQLVSSVKDFQPEMANEALRVIGGFDPAKAKGEATVREKSAIAGGELSSGERAVAAGIQSPVQRTQNLNEPTFNPESRGYSGISDKDARKAVIKEDSARVTAADEDATAARNLITTLDLLDRNYSGTQTGSFTEQKLAVQKALIATLGKDNPLVSELQSQVSSLEGLRSLSLKASFEASSLLKGALSNLENTRLDRVYGDLSTTPAGRAEGIKVQKAAAQRLQQYSSFLRSYRRANETLDGAEDAWVAFTSENPLISEDGKALPENISKWRNYVNYQPGASQPSGEFGQNGLLNPPDLSPASPASKEFTTPSGIKYKVVR